MITKMKRRTALATLLAAGMIGGVSVNSHAADMTFTMATSASETDMRSVAMREVFAPMVAGFADYKAL